MVELDTWQYQTKSDKKTYVSETENTKIIGLKKK